MLNRWKKGQSVSAARLNEMQNAIPRIAGSDGVRVTRAGVNVSIKTTGRDPRHVRNFRALILNSTPSTSGPNRWDYQFAETIKTQSGYDGWTLRTNGRTGDAMNKFEVPNSGSGTQGNGINVDTLPGGFSIQPIASGIVVTIDIERWFNVDGGVVIESGFEYWFSAMNSVDGVCDSGGAT